jgi:excisionase family DNA binding protein
MPRSNSSSLPRDLSQRRGLRIQDAPHYLSATPCFIRSLIARGGLPFVKVGKRFVIDRLDLDRWLDSQKTAQADKKCFSTNEGAL